MSTVRWYIGPGVQYDSFFGLFRVVPLAYGGSQAGGRIGALGYATARAMLDLSSIYLLHYRLRCRIPLNEAWDPHGY